jgi:hypothetical protein
MRELQLSSTGKVHSRAFNKVWGHNIKKPLSCSLFVIIPNDRVRVVALPIGYLREPLG